MGGVRNVDGADAAPSSGADTAASGPRPLLGAGDIRRLAERAGVRPTKHLGQNFVVDANTVRRIVRLAGLGPDDVVLEVGPGLGSLTLALLDVAAAVIAVEIDPVLAAELPATVATWRPDAAGRLRVVVADAVRLDPGEVSTGAVPGRGAGPTALVANLPYNVAVPVLLVALERLPGLRQGLVMVQAEVADRLAARAGQPAYGAPSVKAAWYADVRRSATVPRTVFWPVPNVDSALVAFTRRASPVDVDRESVFACVDAAFAQRRKTLRAALAAWAGSPSRAELVLREAGIDPRERGEQLDVASFCAIALAAQRVPRP